MENDFRTRASHHVSVDADGVGDTLKSASQIFAIVRLWEASWRCLVGRQDSDTYYALLAALCQTTSTLKVPVSNYDLHRSISNAMSYKLVVKTSVS